MTASSEQQRLFFALWPNAAVRDAVAELFRGPLKTLRGRKVAFNNVHITLAFLGSLDVEHRNCIQQVASQVQGRRFELQLNQLGYWARPKVVWLGPKDVPAAASEFQQGLVHALQNCGYVPEKRPFQPHLTLLRKVYKPVPDMAIGNIVWPVDDFVLVRSNTLSTGVEYEVIGRWPLLQN